MANWTMTGPLGSGKSILTISKVKEYLEQGKKIASNMDIYLQHLMPPMSKATYTRLMDFPTSEDLWNLGYGSNSKNEETFGAVVLDELAVFLNSRDWQGKGRDDVIKFLRHVRKQHWHTFFLTQDIESLDAQARRALIEHKVVCSRTDRLSIPLLGTLLRLIGLKGKLMQVHIGSVHYGKTDKSPVVEWWKYMGKSLQTAYNTDQVFMDEPYYDFESPTYYNHRRPFNTTITSIKGTQKNTAYQEGTYTVLSAWHLKGRYMNLSAKYRHYAKPLLILITLIFLIVYWSTQSNKIKKTITSANHTYEPIQNYLNDGKNIYFTTKEGISLTAPTPKIDGKQYKFKVGQTWYVTQ